MKFDFDEVVERRGTDSLKYDFAVRRGKPADVFPLWIADMDFRTAPCVIEALRRDVELGVFGYTETQAPYFEAVAGWYARRFGFETREEWLIKTPGLVFAIGVAVQAFTNPGDAVLLQLPVYYPFSETIADGGRRVLSNTLVERGGRYEIDFEDFERKIVEERVKLFLLCSPHNPVGRVWTREELQRLGEICLAHGVIVFSDEIHSDFVYGGRRHFVFPTVDPRFEKISIVGTSPTKTFNLAGLQISNVFVPNDELRAVYKRWVSAFGYSQANMAGIHACVAAYTGGGEWLGELKEYLAANLAFTREFLRERLPGVRLIEPEGTYLVWLDCRGLGLTHEELDRRILHKAKLWLDSGAIFGTAGEGFQRINIACPRSVLKFALERFALIAE